MITTVVGAIACVIWKHVSVESFLCWIWIIRSAVGGNGTRLDSGSNDGLIDS